MRLTNLCLTLALAPVLAFVPAKQPTITTTLAVRRTMLPSLRRPSLFFPEFDRVFEEMDEMMESMYRPSLSLLQGDFPQNLKLRRPLGFEVTQDNTTYKVDINVPGDVEAKDLTLQLDHDGRVLRLKGERTHEEGGMNILSKFEKSILLPPEIDTTKLSANVSGETLTFVAPKIEKKRAALVPAAETKKIEIHVEEPKQNDEVRATTSLPIEKLKGEHATLDRSSDIETEQKWPARDFPY